MNRCGWILVFMLGVACVAAGCHHAPQAWRRTPSAVLTTGSGKASVASVPDGLPRSPPEEITRVLAVSATVSDANELAAPASAVMLVSASQQPEREAPAAAPADKSLEELPTPASVQTVPLELAQVIESVYQSYPLLKVALLERGIADGQQLAAWGEFDTRVTAYATEAPDGYYQNYRHGVTVTQPTFQGGYLYGGYKIGRGEFQPWYKERQTNEGGEFALGAGLPLLKDRAIDKRRSELFQADLARQGVEPAVQTELLDYVRVASQIYWSWIGAGQVLEARRELLRLAQARVDQIDQRIEAGDLQKLARINNEQLVAARETKLIEAERKLEMVAIKLSLFVRAPTGEPLVPSAGQLPRSFPDHAAIPADQVSRDIDAALATRPELVALDLLYEKGRVELAQAENMLLPTLDAIVMASKDVGEPAERIDDKGPFELEAGLYGEVPLQRRQASGKIEVARAKLAQLRAKREFVANKITAEVQDAVSAQRTAEARIERARTNRRLAQEALQLARDQFEAGDIDLVELNIYEQATLDARFLLIEAEADFFVALADYRAALGVDPLRQARQ
ncbi:MAG: TolC family protein [Pirellulaceae bacterium]